MARRRANMPFSGTTGRIQIWKILLPPGEVRIGLELVHAARKYSM
ncbi:MAG: hypothetical protein R2748_23695 [Bryobacterales bacterium]